MGVSEKTREEAKIGVRYCIPMGNRFRVYREMFLNKNKVSIHGFNRYNDEAKVKRQTHKLN